jgi:hypothetical protein
MKCIVCYKRFDPKYLGSCVIMSEIVLVLQNIVWPWCDVGFIP